jgi:peptidoglycan/LPS O-acetylase OafA/YrhL
VALPFSFGHFSVGVVIVLSGFSLMLPVACSPDKKLNGSFGSYISRRAWRILPGYYAAFVLSALVMWGLTFVQDNPLFLHRAAQDLAPASLLSHLLLLHNWSETYSHATNIALWSVATEWQIYFLFPLVLIPLFRRNPAAMLATALVLGILPVGLLPGMRLDYTCPWYAFLFALGMVGANWAMEPDFLTQKRPRYLPIAATAVALIYVGLKLGLPGEKVHSGFGNLVWLKDIIGGLFAWCLIMSWARATLSHKGQGEPAKKPLGLRILESAFAAKLGQFSYSIYLTHCIILMVLECIIYKLHLHGMMSLGLKVFAGIPLGLGFAYLFFIPFEKPFLRRRESKSQVAKAVVSMANDTVSASVPSESSA